jgi:hypothetical protein
VFVGLMMCLAYVAVCVAGPAEAAWAWLATRYNLVRAWLVGKFDQIRTWLDGDRWQGDVIAGLALVGFLETANYLLNVFISLCRR